MPVGHSATRGGVRAHRRRALRPFLSGLATWIAAAGLMLDAARPAPAHALPAPRLRGMLKSARLVVAGEVTGVTSYDDDRAAVAAFTVDRVFKGALPGAPPLHVAVVELREGPTRHALSVGARGIAFLDQAPRTSYFAKTLPEGTYYQLLPDRGSFIGAASTADAQRYVDVLGRLVTAAQGSAMGAATARQLTFGLLAAQNQWLVDDAGAGIVELRGQPELTEAELATLRAAVQRTDLPDGVRIAVIHAVADAGLVQAVPVLQGVSAPPPVAEAAWQALDRLGAPPPDKTLDARLADRDPATRAAAVRELLRRDRGAAVSQVAPVVIQDPDPAVRKAAVEALGALGTPDAVPPLERVFPDSSTDLQQATARAILAVGGEAAVDALARLAFTGPLDSQRFAVLTLMTMSDPHKDEVLKRVAETHPDEQVRDLVVHGLAYHPD